jgi:hypothetical protein
MPIASQFRRRFTSVRTAARNRRVKSNVRDEIQLNDQCAVAVFANPQQAVHAVRALKDSGLPADRISLVAASLEHQNEEFKQELHYGDKMVKDAAVGAGVGGLLGFLVGAAVFSVSGVGVVFAAASTTRKRGTHAGTSPAMDRRRSNWDSRFGNTGESKTLILEPGCDIRRRLATATRSKWGSQPGGRPAFGPQSPPAREIQQAWPKEQTLGLCPRSELPPRRPRERPILMRRPWSETGANLHARCAFLPFLRPHFAVFSD